MEEESLRQKLRDIVKPWDEHILADRPDPIIGDLALRLNGIETNVAYNTGVLFLALEYEGRVLIYDREKFDNNPEDYVVDQYHAHRSVSELLTLQLNHMYQQWNQLYNEVSELEKMFEFVPEPIQSSIIGLRKLTNIPHFLLRFTTQRRHMRRQIGVAQKFVESYALLRGIAEYGVQFVGSIPEEDFLRLRSDNRLFFELLKVQIGEVAYKFQRAEGHNEKMKKKLIQHFNIYYGENETS
jgi:hypothetical protein